MCEISIFLPAAKKINVLIVDDSELITDRIAALINEVSCVSKVFVSDSYAGAMKIIDEKQLEVALLDIHLPQKSGIDLLHYLRKSYPSVKVMMVTNKASDYYRVLCKDLGADHFIDKSREFENDPRFDRSILLSFLLLVALYILFNIIKKHTLLEQLIERNDIFLSSLCLQNQPYYLKMVKFYFLFFFYSVFAAMRKFPLL